MVNIQEELEKYRPINLDELLMRSPGLSDNIINSIKHFNKALEDINNKNEDIAIIGLKKAISLNSTFYEAMNLLGICHLSIGEEDVAKDIFHEVIEAEHSSIQALGYINDIDGVEKHETKARSKKKKSSSQKPKRIISYVANGIEKDGKKGKILVYAMCFLLGVVLTLVFWQIRPGDKPFISITKADSTQAAQNLLSEKESEINKLQQENIELENEIKKLKEENTILEKAYNEYKLGVELINNIELLVMQNQYEDAANDLLMIEESSLSPTFVSMYRDLKAQVFPIAAKTYYDAGYQTYYSKTGPEDVDTCIKALYEFEKAIELGDNFEFMPELYYLAGKSAARGNEIKRAKELFNLIIDNYPNEVQATHARTRIAEIDEGKPITGN